MKKINLFVLVIAILVTFMYINSRERVAALSDSVKDYLTQVEELQEQLAKTNAPIPPSNLPETKFEENTYPVYAELVDSDEEHGEYRFRVLNVTQDDGFDGIYTFETDMVVYEDAPYILTMDNNGTKETSDDYIAVVWIATP